eukprot:TRINITY_DN8830_c0_g1_i2.p1 TRINITY_DN8830_c0_g1~~TRINITY_DN8830_c0_g1_i2.p1  ORF type:complete len:281 (+),score=16.82 TRINITY_DN8830_c0_g1_i2:94-936(+)
MSKQVHYFVRSNANQIIVYAIVLTIFSISMQKKGDGLWKNIIQKYNHPEVVTMATCTMLVYWIVSLFFAVVDLKQWPGAVSKRKIQQDKKINPQTYVSAALPVFIQQILVMYPLQLLFCELVMPWRYRSVSFGLSGLEWWSVIVSFFVYTLIEEVLFFSGHLIFHKPVLYKWVHKVHHSYSAPIGVAATYAHPVENIFVNFLPLLVGPVLLGSHCLMYTFWISFAAFNSVYTHSGYDIPGLPMANKHDFHHMSFRENYGVIGIMDYICNTNKVYIAKTAN